MPSHIESLAPNLPARQGFPEVLDNTMIAAYVDCHRKFAYEFMQQLAPLGVNIDLHAGACFAAALETARMSFYRDGVSAGNSVAAAFKTLVLEWGDVETGDHVKSLDRVAGALEYYFAVWPLGKDYLVPMVVDGIPRIEFHFLLPIDIKHPVTGNPILFSGRTDMLATHKAGGNYVEDDKTTKQLGGSWGRQWLLRSQFCGYTWAARQYKYDIQGTVIRGVSILKTKYDHAEEIVAQPEWKVKRWYTHWLLENVANMIADWQRGFFAWSLGTACTHYGSCPYMQLCDTDHPESWADGNYQTRIWDPTKTKPKIQDVTPQAIAR